MTTPPLTSPPTLHKLFLWPSTMFIRARARNVRRNYYLLVLLTLADAHKRTHVGVNKQAEYVFRDHRCLTKNVNGTIVLQFPLTCYLSSDPDKYTSISKESV